MTASNVGVPEMTCDSTGSSCMTSVSDGYVKSKFPARANLGSTAAATGAVGGSEVECGSWNGSGA